MSVNNLSIPLVWKHQVLSPFKENKPICSLTSVAKTCLEIIKKVLHSFRLPYRLGESAEDAYCPSSTISKPTKKSVQLTCQNFFICFKYHSASSAYENTR